MFDVAQHIHANKQQSHSHLKSITLLAFLNTFLTVPWVNLLQTNWKSHFMCWVEALQLNVKQRYFIVGTLQQTLQSLSATMHILPYNGATQDSLYPL